MFYFFFFFKQKTAYEIYQCDWSSDVCSSDLMGIMKEDEYLEITPHHIRLRKKFLTKHGRVQAKRKNTKQ